MAAPVRFLRAKQIQNSFTIVELLVAMAVLALLVLLFSQTINAMTKVWSTMRSRVTTFEEARSGFESMTRKIGQASLNTYWDYNNYTNSAIITSVVASTNYVRQSDLHFISGPVLASSVSGSQALPNNGPFASLNPTTHAIFFQAPLGFTYASAANAPPLQKLVNACGFVVSHSVTQRPNFINALPGFAAPTKRYRLMELWQPTEQLEEYYYYQAYASPNGQTSANAANLYNWYSDAVSNGELHLLAQNVLALVIWPRRSVQDATKASGVNDPLLTSNYAYDTRNYTATSPSTYASLTRNQLPPVVQVTMVAIDEASATRLENLPSSSTAALLAANTLFESLGTGTTVPLQTVNYNNDLNLLIAAMKTDRLNYRVYTTSVTINQAKWSAN